MKHAVLAFLSLAISASIFGCSSPDEPRPELGPVIYPAPVPAPPPVEKRARLEEVAFVATILRGPIPVRVPAAICWTTTAREGECPDCVADELQERTVRRVAFADGPARGSARRLPREELAEAPGGAGGVTPQPRPLDLARSDSRVRPDKLEGLGESPRPGRLVEVETCLCLGRPETRLDPPASFQTPIFSRTPTIPALNLSSNFLSAMLFSRRRICTFGRAESTTMTPILLARSVAR